MPRENKKRGRRGGEVKKRKMEDLDGEDQEPSKRVRLEEDDPQQEGMSRNDYEPLERPALGHDDVEQSYNRVGEKVFYGMLDEEEQEYFRKADQLLENDAFGDDDERTLLLDNVFKEADGKELKLACSQSCSRLMERLIQLASAPQLSKLFQKFSGHFLDLVQHRFASHCCEKLLIKVAPLVTAELLRKPGAAMERLIEGDIYVSMENLVLHTVAEFDGNVGFLMTDRFGSHVLRVILLVLAGEPLTSHNSKGVLQSKKKENVTVSGESAEVTTSLAQQRPVPKSFTESLENLMSGCVKGLQTQGLRALATHPLGSPILQLLVRLELTHFGKSRAKDAASIYRGLLPEEPVTQQTESAGFVNGLNYDPIGSHLLESVIEHVPGKTFKGLYKEFWKDRLASLSRNEVAMYVVCKLLNRIGKDDLIEAHEAILPVIPELLDRNRTGVIRVLIERCAVRKVDTQAIAVALEAYFGGGDGFDLLKLLRLTSSTGNDSSLSEQMSRSSVHGSSKTDSTGTNTLPLQSAQTDQMRVQGSILAQAMILVPGPLSSLIFDSICQLATADLVTIAKNPITSRTLQATMTSTNGSIISRRKLVQQFYGEMGVMALDTAASHVVDAIWEGTHGLAFIRERIAEELADNEVKLRDSPCGRAVWKNWKMDLYKRRRHEWVLQSRNKASNDGFQSFEELERNKNQLEDIVSQHKTAQAGDNAPPKDDVLDKSKSMPHQRARAARPSIVEARERHAQRKQLSKEKRESQSERRRRAEGLASA